MSNEVAQFQLWNEEQDKKNEVLPQANNEVTITSLEIAELTGKEHKNICRDIVEQLGKIGDTLKFERIYFDSQNRQRRMFELPKRESLILVSGYSVELRAKIIDRLEYLENEFKKQSTPKLPTYAEALRELADKVERVAQLENKIQEDAPKVAFAEQIATTANAISVRKFAKILHDENIPLGEKKLFVWLREKGYLMPNNEPYQKYVDSGYFEIRQGTYKTSYGEKSYTQTLITGKGQIYFCEKMRKEHK